MFVEKSVQVGGKEHLYQVWVPDAVKPPYAAILFLHGRGECGQDGQKMTQVGLGEAVTKEPNRWPFLIVFPQNASEGVWSEELETLTGILIQTSSEYALDASHLYITGLSLGGNGTLTLANKLPWKFAAASAICGWADPLKLRDGVGEIPLRLYHGLQDALIPPEASLLVAKWMATRRQTQIELIIYSHDQHNSWNSAYQTSDMPQWFLSYSLKAEIDQ